jgi:hypothetical protein
VRWFCAAALIVGKLNRERHSLRHVQMRWLSVGEVLPKIRLNW